MSTADSVIPPRGTPKFRMWLWRTGVNLILPFGTALLAFLTLRETGSGPWSEASGWMIFGLVAAGVIGLVALFDAHTRVVGAFAILLVLLLNPITMTLLLSMVRP